MLFETHSHTRYGSACSYMSPEEMVKRAVQVGLDGICITEHDIPWDRNATKRLSDRFGILVLGAMEVSTNRGEVLVWGLHEPVFDIADIDDLRRRVEKAAGFMVAAHPFRGARSFIDWDPVKGLILKTEEATKLPILDFVDAMEVFNGMAPDWEIDLSCQVCDRRSILGTGGSDSHNVDTVGQCVTVLQKRVDTETEFIKEMRSGNYHARHRILNRVYPDNGSGPLSEER